MSVAGQAITMVHDKDPKQQILDDVAPYIGDIEPMADQIIVGVYERPEKTAGGIFLSQTYRAEDRFQGIVGLVLKMGPIAFTEDETHRFGGVKPKVGDFVIFNVGETWSFLLGKRKCRMLFDVNVRGIVTKPDVVL